MQIDNQSEPLPAYPVMIKPRDLYYQDGEIIVKVEETKEDREKRLNSGLDLINKNTAKVFMSEIVIEKKENN